MKFSAVPWVAAGAGLALFQGAEAAPIRYSIVVHSGFVGTTPTTTTSEGGLPSFFRFGHATGLGNMPGSLNPDQLKKPCGMHKMVAVDGSKPALTLSDTLRQALGLEPIAEHTHKLEYGVKIPAHMHSGLPVMAQSHDLMGSSKPVPPPVENMWKAHSLENMNHVHFKQSSVDTESSFVHRLHFALNNLEAWEARAVAFVLGCGIGVLLRMLWIFAVLIIRGVREETSSEDDYTLIIAQVAEPTTLPKYEDDAAAPAYVDEKAIPPSSGA